VLKTLRLHPRGLAVLFFTEAWERFSFYGMRALLVLYMTEALLLPGSVQRVAGYEALHGFLQGIFGPLSVQAMSSQIYGMYAGLLYLTPFLGGLLADRVTGQRRAVQLGGTLMAIGHFLMAFETWFFVALLCIVLGNGCFKPNISAQVGDLYDKGDNRRDSAFSIFYVGINIGAFIAPAVCGTLGEVYGWHYGFFAAGIGMLIGLAVFTAGDRYLPPDTRQRSRVRAARSGVRQAGSPSDLQSIGVLCVIAFVLTFFWAAFEQQGNAIVLWIRDYTDRSFFGVADIKITWFQAINPLLIFLLTPPLLVCWAFLARHQREPGPAAKMIIGCCLGGGAYLLLAWSATGPADIKIDWLWTAACLGLLTMGELLISPVALSLFSRVAPLKAVSMMVGVWFMSGALGNYFAGIIGSYWERLPKSEFWFLIAMSCFAAGFLMFLLKRTVENMIADRR
jgi:proton-dependent oligopeptide transporter, POT family